MERSVLTPTMPFIKGRLSNVRSNALRNGRYFIMLLLLMATAALGAHAQAPVINTVNPTGGPIGTVVTITGSNLASANSVTIGGQATEVVSNTGSVMKAVVMPNTTSGALSISNAIGTANAKDNFTVTGTPYPSIQQGGIFLASNTVGNTNQGWSVALSADGNTAVIGAINDDATSSQSGAVFVVTRVGGVWTQQAKLFGNDAVGYAQQGTSVAITPDGNTILVGGYYDNYEVGACWIYKRSGTTWVQQGSKITVSGPTYVSGFGQSVSLSADGNTFVAGAPNSEGVVNTNQTGISVVFSFVNGAWVQQAILQDPAVSQQGEAVSISADASTIAVGSNSGVDVYTYANNRWAQPGTSMVATGATVFGFGGNSLSFSADGNTLAAGDIQDGNYIGAVWIFTRTNGLWSQQGSKITASDASGQARQGSSVSLSADGNTMAEGGLGDNGYTGAAWVFTQNNGVWTQKGPKLVGTGASTLPEQGSSLALSANGTTLAVGGQHNGGGFPCLGGTWFFATNVQAPTTQATNISFANTQGYSTQVSWVAGDGGTRAVFVSPGSSGTAAPATNTTYNANSVFGSGDQIGSSGWYCVYNGTGTSVKLTGLTPSNTYNLMVVEYNGTPGLEQYLTTTSSGNPATVTTGPPGPVISSFSPSSGPVGTLVTITGSNLSSPTAFTIGGQPAIVISNDGSTLVGMVMPNATSGCISLTTALGVATGGSTFTVAAAAPPLLQQGAKLTESGGGYSQLGAAIALSSDGNTALVGAPLDNSQNGDAVVFIRSGGAWTQSAVLIGSGSSGGFFGGASEGHSVALSADGNTAVIGGNQDGSNEGAVWVFTRSGSSWTQQGSKLVGTDAGGEGGGDLLPGSNNDQQGTSVALSADGNTMIEGGQGANSGNGAAWVFTRSAGVWSQAAELAGTGSGTGQANQGSSVAISADGATILVAGKADNDDRGAVWVFTGSGSTWTQQGTKLTPSDANTSDGGPYFGTSTALSADGNTAIIGGPADASLKGASWIFTRSSGVWSQQGSKLFGTGSVGQAQQGWSVAISADGNTATEGGLEDNDAVGASWVFTRSGSTWNQQGTKLIGTGASGSGSQGTSVALSADGSTAIEGASVDNGGVGAAWAFAGSSAPATQASNITFANTTQTTTTIGWTPGNGAAEAVFMQLGSSGTITPSNNTTYTPNTAFSSGTQIGSTGWYCVFNGTGNSVNVTGLTLNTNYHVMVFDYNGTPGAEQYLTATGTSNPADLTTLPLPAIYSISAASANPTNKTSIDYTVTFASPVTNLDVSNFSLTTTGAVSGAAVVSVTGSGTTFDVNINAGTGEGTIQLSMVNANGVLPGTSTQLPFAGDIYTIDRTPPSGSINYFNDYTSNSNTAQVGDQLGIGFNAGDATTATVTFDGNTADNVSNFFGWNASYTTRSTDAPGPITVVVTLTDAAGNSTQLTANGITLVNPSYVSTTSTIVSIVPATSSPTTATTLDYTVAFSSALTTGPTTGDFSLATTGTATGTINSVTTNDNINYDINVTNVSGDGTLELDMPGTLGDVSPSLTNVPFTSGPAGTYTIDNPPTASVVSFTSNDSKATGVAVPGDQVTLSFSTSEPVQTPVVNIGNTTSNGNAAVSNPSGDNQTFTATYTLLTTDSPDVPGNVPYIIGLTDLAGNTASYTELSPGNPNLTFDAAPTVQASNITFSNITANSATINWTPGNGNSEMILMAPVGTPAELPVNNNGYGYYATYGGFPFSTGSNWSIVYNNLTPSSPASATVNGGLTGGTAYTVMVIDYNEFSSYTEFAYLTTPGTNNPATLNTQVPPTTIVSIAASTSSPTNATTLDYTVTFAEALTSPPTTGDFALTGTATGTINTISGSGTTYDVNVTNVSGNGALGLNMISASDVSPAISTPLPFNGGAYTIDNTPPTAANITFSSNNANPAIAVAGNVMTLSFTASETIQAPTVKIEGNTIAAVNTSGNNWTATYTMQSTDSKGRIPFTLQFSDLAGNTSSTYTDQTQSIDEELKSTDALLDNLTLSNGTLNTPFATNTTSYNTSVGNGLTTMTITPTADDPNATITVQGQPATTGQPSQYLTLAVGNNNILIVVTASDGSSTQTYTLVVKEAKSQNNNLLGLAPNTGALSPAFTTGNTTYTETVPFGTSTITLTPATADPTATVTVNGNSPATAASLSVGQNNIPVVVTSQLGTTKTYTVTVTRLPNVTLSSITSSNGTLNPAFASTTLSYAIAVGNGLTTMTVTPTASDPAATITVQGQPVTTGQPSQHLVLAVGPNNIPIVVTGSDHMTTQTYTLVITEAKSGNNNLSALAPNTGTLSPAFTMGNTSYTETVAYGTNTITLTPATADPTATVTVNGQSSTTPVTLSAGQNSIPVMVTAQNGAIQTYTVTVTLPPVDVNLNNITLSNGTLSPAFNASTLSYSTNVGNGLSTMTITPTADDPNATITVQGQPATSGQPSQYLALAVGQNTIPIIVTGADHSTTQTYTIAVTEAKSGNNSLSALTTSNGTLSPAFTASNTSYSESLPYGTPNITLTPTTADPTATVTVNGNSPTTPVTLSPGQNNIPVVVTAQNGTPKTYTVTVSLPAADVNLNNITLSNGTLSPVFNANTTNYSTSVGNGLTTMTVTPTADDPGATIMVQGQPATSGQPSQYLILAVGTNTIPIVVTGSDHSTTQTYTLVVKEAKCANTNLSKLTISSGPLSPAFRTADITYTASVANAISSINVTPTVANSTSAVTVNNLPATSGEASAVNLEVGDNAIPVTVTAQSGATKTYTITVTRAAGSDNTVYQPVSVEKPIETPALNNDGILVHQAISPNGDGINDFLQIDNISQYPDNKLSIMNRNGQLIYEASGYDNSSKVFDGHSNKNGQMQLPGTYFYQLDYTVNGITKHKTGFLVLKY